MIKLCSSVADIKLTRGRQNSISGWVTPYQRRRGRRVAKPVNKSTTMDCSDSLERVEKSHYISFDRVENSITGQKASKWREIVFSPVNAANICVFSMQTFRRKRRLRSYKYISSPRGYFSKPKTCGYLAKILF